MYLTMEVRWFCPGALPGQFLDRLDRAGYLPPSQPAREDHYLRLPAQPNLSIKLREGNVEVKTQLGDAREVQVSPPAVGMLALWRKWSFPLALESISRAALGSTSRATPLGRWLVPPSAWISVEKERRLQRYRLAGDRVATSVPLGTPANLGCEFELSRVRAGGEEWWSACFEAFGSQSGLERAIMTVAAQVMGPGWPFCLDVEHSLSYPRWLSRFAAPINPTSR
jgi:hypothetical protein